MKRLLIIFVLIYLNVTGRYCMLPNNILEIDNFGVPSPYEFLWITTVSYCNVHYLTYNMFIGVGVPIKEQMYSNDDIAGFLLPENIYEWSDETVLDSPYKFIKLREASQIIESFVFEIKEFQNVTGTEDISTGLNIWKSIEDNMVDFMNNISILSNQVNQVINDMNILQNNTVDTSAMMYLYMDIFENMVDIMTENIVPYKNAFNFLEKYNLKTYQKKNIEQDKKIENNLNSREYTRVKLAKVYELYIESLTIFYNSEFVDKHFSKLNFVMWYDINSSKSIFDYTASKLLTHIIKLREYIEEAYKFNKKKIPAITSKVQEYVSINLYNIVGVIRSPLQKILKDEDLIKNDVLSCPKSYDKMMINGLLSSKNEDLHKRRIKNIKLSWNDSTIQIVAWDIINKYNSSVCDTNVNHNTKLMYWAEQMSIDEQKINVLESSIYAMIIIKNLENVVLCSNIETKSEPDIEELIQNLIDDVDQKLNEIYKYSIYSIIESKENVISDVWKYIENENNNIFNILDWLNKNESKTNIPYWPNDVPCNEIYIKNIIQLASVSSDMLYDVTLTSMHRALENNEIDNAIEESNALFILKDLERAKHTYKNVIQQIKNLIRINTMYIKSNNLIDINLKNKAIQELAKCIKYKIFAITELIIPAFRNTEYYNLVVPEDTHDYTEHISNMNTIFYSYFRKTTDLQKKNETALNLIKKNEHEIISIYNTLRYKHQKVKKKHRYMKVLKYNMISVKRMYRTIINQLKKITKVNNNLNLKNNEQEIRRRLMITVALIMEDFIRFDIYIDCQHKITPLYNGRYKYIISGIDLEIQNKKIDYIKIYKKIRSKSSKIPDAQTDNTLSSVSTKSLTSTAVSTNQGADSLDTPNMPSVNNLDIEKTVVSGKDIVSKTIGTSDESSSIDLQSEKTVQFSSLQSTSTKVSMEQSSDENNIPDVLSATNIDTGNTKINAKDISTTPLDYFDDTMFPEAKTDNTLSSVSTKSLTSTAVSTNQGADSLDTPDMASVNNLDIEKTVISGKDIVSKTIGTSDESSSIDLQSEKTVQFSSLQSTSTKVSMEQSSEENKIPDVLSATNIDTVNTKINAKDISTTPLDYYDDTMFPEAQTDNTLSSVSTKSLTSTALSTNQGADSLDTPDMASVNNLDIEKTVISGKDIVSKTIGTSDESSSIDLQSEKTVQFSSLQSTSTKVSMEQSSDENNIPDVLSATNIDTGNTKINAKDISTTPLDYFDDTMFPEAKTDNTLSSVSTKSLTSTAVSTNQGADSLDTPNMPSVNNLDIEKTVVSGKDIVSKTIGTSDESSSIDLQTEKTVQFSSLQSTSTKVSMEQSSDENNIPDVLSATNIDTGNTKINAKDISTTPLDYFDDTMFPEAKTDNTLSSVSTKSLTSTAVSTNQGADSLDTPDTASVNNLDIEKTVISGKDIVSKTIGTSDESSSIDLQTEKTVQFSSLQSTSTKVSMEQSSDENNIPDVLSATNIDTGNTKINAKDISTTPLDYFDDTMFPEAKTDNTLSSVSTKSLTSTAVSTNQGADSLDTPDTASVNNLDIEKTVISGKDIVSKTIGTSDESSSIDLQTDKTVQFSSLQSTSTKVSMEQSSDENNIPDVLSATNIDTGNTKLNAKDISTTPLDYFDDTMFPEAQADNTLSSVSTKSLTSTAVSTNQGADFLDTPDTASVNNLDIEKTVISGKDIVSKTIGTSDESSSIDLQTEKTVQFSSLQSTSTKVSMEQSSDENNIPDVLSATNIDTGNTKLNAKDISTTPLDYFDDTMFPEAKTDNTLSSVSTKSLTSTNVSTNQGADSLDTPDTASVSNLDIEKTVISGKDIVSKTIGTSDESSSIDLQTEKTVQFSSLQSTSTKVSMEQSSDENNIPDVLSATNIDTGNTKINAKDISTTPLDYFDDTKFPEAKTDNTLSSVSTKSLTSTAVSTNQGADSLGTPDTASVNNLDIEKTVISGKDIVSKTIGTSDESSSIDLQTEKTVQFSSLQSTSTKVSMEQSSDENNIPDVLSATNIDTGNTKLNAKDISTTPLDYFDDTMFPEAKTDNTLSSVSTKSLTSTAVSTNQGADSLDTPDTASVNNLDIEKTVISGKDIVSKTIGTSDESSSIDLQTEKTVQFSSLQSTSTKVSMEQSSDENNIPDVLSATNIDTGNTKINAKDISTTPVDYFDDTMFPKAQADNTLSSVSTKSLNSTAVSTNQGADSLDTPDTASVSNLDIEKTVISGKDIVSKTIGTSDESSLIDLQTEKTVQFSSLQSTSTKVSMEQSSDENNIPDVLSATNIDTGNTKINAKDISTTPLDYFDDTMFPEAKTDNTLSSVSTKSLTSTAVSTNQGADSLGTPDTASVNNLDIEKTVISGKDIVSKTIGTSDESSSIDLQTDKTVQFSSLQSTSTKVSMEQSSDENNIPDVLSATNIDTSNTKINAKDISTTPVDYFDDTMFPKAQTDNTLSSVSTKSLNSTALSTNQGADSLDTPDMASVNNLDIEKTVISGKDIVSKTIGTSDESSSIDLQTEKTVQFSSLQSTSTKVSMEQSSDENNIPDVLSATNIDTGNTKLNAKDISTTPLDYFDDTMFPEAKTDNTLSSVSTKSLTSTAVSTNQGADSLDTPDTASVNNLDIEKTVISGKDIVSKTIGTSDESSSIDLQTEKTVQFSSLQSTSTKVSMEQSSDENNIPDVLSATNIDTGNTKINAKDISTTPVDYFDDTMFPKAQADDTLSSVSTKSLNSTAVSTNQGADSLDTPDTASVSNLDIEKTVISGKDIVSKTIGTSDESSSIDLQTEKTVQFSSLQSTSTKVSMEQSSDENNIPDVLSATNIDTGNTKLNAKDISTTPLDYFDDTMFPEAKTDNTLSSVSTKSLTSTAVSTNQGADSLDTPDSASVNNLDIEKTVISGKDIVSKTIGTSDESSSIDLQTEKTVQFSSLQSTSTKVSMEQSSDENNIPDVLSATNIDTGNTKINAKDIPTTPVDYFDDTMFPKAQADDTLSSVSTKSLNSTAVSTNQGADSLDTPDTASVSNLDIEKTVISGKDIVSKTIGTSDESSSIDLQTEKTVQFSSLQSTSTKVSMEQSSDENNIPDVLSATNIDTGNTKLNAKDISTTPLDYFDDTMFPEAKTDNTLSSVSTKSLTSTAVSTNQGADSLDTPDTASVNNLDIEKTVISGKDIVSKTIGTSDESSSIDLQTEKTVQFSSLQSTSTKVSMEQSSDENNIPDVLSATNIDTGNTKINAKDISTTPVDYFDDTMFPEAKTDNTLSSVSTKSLTSTAVSTNQGADSLDTPDTASVNNLDIEKTVISGKDIVSKTIGTSDESSSIDLQTEKTVQFSSLQSTSTKVSMEQSSDENNIPDVLSATNIDTSNTKINAKDISTTPLDYFDDTMFPEAKKDNTLSSVSTKSLTSTAVSTNQGADTLGTPDTASVNNLDIEKTVISGKDIVSKTIGTSDESSSIDLQTEKTVQFSSLQSTSTKVSMEQSSDENNIPDVLSATNIDTGNTKINAKDISTTPVDYFDDTMFPKAQTDNTLSSVSTKSLNSTAVSTNQGADSLDTPDTASVNNLDIEKTVISGKDIVSKTIGTSDESSSIDLQTEKTVQFSSLQSTSTKVSMEQSSDENNIPDVLSATNIDTGNTKLNAKDISTTPLDYFDDTMFPEAKTDNTLSSVSTKSLTSTAVSTNQGADSLDTPDTASVNNLDIEKTVISGKDIVSKTIGTSDESSSIDLQTEKTVQFSSLQSTSTKVSMEQSSDENNIPDVLSATNIDTGNTKINAKDISTTPVDYFDDTMFPEAKTDNTLSSVSTKSLTSTAVSTNQGADSNDTPDMASVNNLDIEKTVISGKDIVSKTIGTSDESSSIDLQTEKTVQFSSLQSTSTKVSMEQSSDENNIPDVLSATNIDTGNTKLNAKDISTTPLDYFDDTMFPEAKTDNTLSSVSTKSLTSTAVSTNQGADSLDTPDTASVNNLDIEKTVISGKDIVSKTIGTSDESSSIDLQTEKTVQFSSLQSTSTKVSMEQSSDENNIPDVLSATNIDTGNTK
ncbi:uncharacterized protein LOC107882155 [Acyrthosiphon pisum]|uniref:Uncharacterized protein n=1 Tax=Acyrthosiphon pisum TaxID=7029 RepID=A0A8R2JRC4_ACYPI|nr:uncharacterized protein LOC107882155 [Acyrthosiphon pisum]